MNTRIHAAVLAVLLAPLSYSASLEAKSSTKPATLDMGPGCRVGLRVPLNADFDSARPESGIPGQGGLSIKNPLALKRDTYTNPFALRFVCYDANTEDANRGLINNGWAKQLPDGSWAANVMPGDEDLYARAYQLRTKTASGWAVAVEDVIGHVDERLRARWLHYCLIRQPKAICGTAEVGNLNDIRRNRKNDLAPYALQILRSVEFLDDAQPSTPVPTPAAETASTPR